MHKKCWIHGAVHMHLEPPPILLIKINNDAELDKDCIKIKFPRDPTAEKLDLCEFKISLFVKA